MDRVVVLAGALDGVVPVNGLHRAGAAHRAHRHPRHDVPDSAALTFNTSTAVVLCSSNVAVTYFSSRRLLGAGRDPVGATTSRSVVLPAGSPRWRGVESCGTQLR